MTQPSRLLYLPPGVAGTPTPGPATAAVVSAGVPFDRNFLEHVLPPAVQAFCQQVDCGSPIVELLTVDGMKHYVKNVAGVSDSWVALHTSAEDHDQPIQVFLPYQTIFRVEIHPAEDHNRGRLGFVLSKPTP